MSPVKIKNREQQWTHIREFPSGCGVWGRCNPQKYLYFWLEWNEILILIVRWKKKSKKIKELLWNFHWWFELAGNFDFPTGFYRSPVVISITEHRYKSFWKETRATAILLHHSIFSCKTFHLMWQCFLRNKIPSFHLCIGI